MIKKSVGALGSVGESYGVLEILAERWETLGSVREP